jgi:hypothetical protein
MDYCEFIHWLKIIKLRLETSLKSQASDWLKWRLVIMGTNKMLNLLLRWSLFTGGLKNRAQDHKTKIGDQSQISSI